MFEPICLNNKRHRKGSVTAEYREFDAWKVIMLVIYPSWKSLICVNIKEKIKLEIYATCNNEADNSFISNDFQHFI